jgi:hypothetical protein
MILAAVEVMPLIIVVKRLAVEVATLELIKVVVAIAPLVVLVKVLADELSVFVVEEAKIALILPITALAMVVVPSKDILVKPLIVVVETIPSTVEVIKLVEDEKLRLLVVVAAIKLAKLVVEITPFTLLVIIPVLVAKLT